MTDAPKLEALLEEAFARYFKQANDRKLPMIWDYQEWLDNSEVARRLINEHYEPWTQQTH